MRRAAPAVIVILAGICLALLVSGRLLIVRTGSMSPTVNAGDAILLGSIEDVPEVGEIVTYARHGQLVTHRVVEVRGSRLVTQGDANQDADPWIVQREQIRGRMLWRLPYVGWFLAFLRQPGGWFLFVIVPASVLVWMRSRRTVALLRAWREETGDRAPPPDPVPSERDAFVYVAPELRGSRAEAPRRIGTEHVLVLVVVLLVISAIAVRGALARFSSSRDSILGVSTAASFATSATVDIKPESLQKKSQGASVTAFIELPADREPGSIDPTTVRLCLAGEGPCTSGVPAEEPRWGDADHDGVPDLKVQFSRAEVIALVADVVPPLDVVFTVSGSAGGRMFVGSDAVKLVDPDGKDEPTPTPSPESTEPSPTPPPSPSPEASEGPTHADPTPSPWEPAPPTSDPPSPSPPPPAPSKSTPPTPTPAPSPS